MKRIIRPVRPKTPAFAGYTGGDGFRASDAPENWPFGRKHPDPWIKAFKDAAAAAKARRLAARKEEENRND